MSVKIYDREQRKWVIFPGTVGTPGKDAYVIAQENGYTGTKAEYTQALLDMPRTVNYIKNTDDVPTKDSTNLVKSGGAWRAIEDVIEKVDGLKESNNNKFDVIDLALDNIRHAEIPNQIKESIVDNLESSCDHKSLSAQQGKVLKDMIDNLANVRFKVVDELPFIGEENVIYLLKKEGTDNDLHDEYVYIDDDWEKIGNNEIDLSNYATKDDLKVVQNSIPDISISNSGNGNVITGITVDTTNKHQLNITKNLDTYSKEHIDNNLHISWSRIDSKPTTFKPSAHEHNVSEISGLGSLATKSEITTDDLSFTIPEGISVDKDLSDTSTNPVQNNTITNKFKEYLTKTESENLQIKWSNISNKPTTFTPSSHTHPTSQITGLGTLAGKNSVNMDDLGDDVKTAISAGGGGGEVDLSGYYTKTQVDNLINGIDCTCEVDLTPYALKDNVYTKSEVDNKIANVSSGGSIDLSGYVTTDSLNTTLSNYVTTETLNSKGYGDVDGSYTWSFSGSEGKIIISDGYKVVKPSDITLNDLARKSEIPSNSWRPIKVGDTTLSDTSTALTFAAGSNINFSFNNGTLTINSTGGGSGESSYTLPAATSNTLGGIKVGYSSSTKNNLPVSLSNEQAYVTITKDAVNTALGYTPMSFGDMSVTRRLLFAILEGATVTAGYSYYNTTQTTISSYSGFSQTVQDSIIASTKKITFNNENFLIMEKVNNLSTTTGVYIYCLTLLQSGKIAINGSVYK